MSEKDQIENTPEDANEGITNLLLRVLKMLTHYAANIVPWVLYIGKDNYTVHFPHQGQGSMKKMSPPEEPNDYPN